MNDIKKIESGWFFHNHAWSLLHEIIKQIPGNTKSLLDVGAGSGLAAAIIKAIYPDIKITVCDISENSFDFWEKRNLSGFLIENDLLHFEDDEVDIIICSHVLEHITAPKKLFDEMYRVCGKRLTIVVPDGDYHIKEHVQIYDRKIFSERLNYYLTGKEYNLTIYPLYNPHINNLIAVIDK